jgi:uncharacterized membrane protein YcaP (DUF421 family)
MDKLFFTGWAGPLRTVILGILSYCILIFVLRISGKRTLAKMNAFDLVVTVALGSTLATILLNKNVALLEGATALLVLVLLQFSITWPAVRYGWVEPVVKNEPALLVDAGRFVRENMLRERVTEEEIRAAARASGFSEMSEKMSIVLETDGSFSVIFRERARADAEPLGRRL